MGSLSHESFDDFLDSLKEAGIVITNETELRERLAEAQRWRYAFRTLAANGSLIGIRFADGSDGHNEDEVRRTFEAFEFPESFRDVFAESLKTKN